MSTVTEQHIPCPCGKSSDAYCRYDDGHGHCYSCGVTHQPTPQTDYTFEYLPWRSVTKETMEKYDVLSRVKPDGEPDAIAFPYPSGARQIRPFADKHGIRWKDHTQETALGGRDNFAPGSAKAITICEGAIDALSAYQML